MHACSGSKALLETVSELVHKLLKTFRVIACLALILCFLLCIRGSLGTNKSILIELFK
jgi:hypothetical protein